jgi:hypothetical protein
VIDSEFISEPHCNALFQSTLAAIPANVAGGKSLPDRIKSGPEILQNSGTPPLNWVRTGIGLRKYIRVQPTLSKNLEQNLEQDMELLPNVLSKKRGHGLSQMPINARD